MTDETTVERELGWDDEIENDGEGGDFTLLPDGEYPFTVKSYDRERYAGGEKVPPCNKAVIWLKVDGGDLGETTVRDSLLLHTKTEGFVCAFFTAIGQRQHGERAKMNWPSVPGSTGRVKLDHRTYKNDAGKDVTVNEVKRYIDPEKTTDATPATYAAGKF